MITDIKVYKFAFTIKVLAGDSLCVQHRAVIVVNHTAEFNAEWTCSITFKLNGQTNWILGNQETIDWLKSQLFEQDGVAGIEVHQQ